MQQLRIGFSEIQYRIERSSRRRTVCIIVHPRDGVTVKAPPWTSEAEIEHFVRLKSAWIVKHQTIYAASVPAEQLATRQLVDGASLPCLGEPLTLCLDIRQRAGQLARSRVERTGTELRVSLRLPPASDASAALRGAVERWYRAEARRRLAPRLAHFAAQLGLPAPALFIREQQRRWGSCNRRAEIRLNWRIMLGPAEVADYLCAHEVAHLRQMNHSPRFWKLVEKLLPDYKALRRQLRNEGHSYTL